MKALWQNLTPQIFLRLGLGIMYVYSGADLFFNPQHWYGFVPAWFTRFLLPVISVDTYLAMQGVGEILIGLVFLAWLAPRWLVWKVAFLAALEMALILMFIGVDPITFRDIGLLGAALALLLIYQRQ